MKDFFKKKMSAMRFCAETPTRCTPEDLIEGLQKHAFVEDLTMVDNIGFVDYESPYGGENLFSKTKHVYQNNWVGLIRFDKRQIPASALKLRVNEVVEAEKKQLGKPFVSRARKQEIKEQCKFKLLVKAIPSTTFVPFVVDMDTGNGYFYSTSNTKFELFRDLFSRVFRANIRRDYRDTCSEDFLTYIWWETERNSFFVPIVRGEEVKTWIGSRVSTVSEDQKLSISGESLEEAKLPISEGAYVSKMELSIASLYGDRTFSVDLDGVISGMQFTDEEVPNKDSEDISLVLDMTAFYFEVMDAWRKAYEEAEQSGRSLTPEIKKTWGRGAYCSKAFEDV